MDLHIYYNARRAKHIVRNDRSREEFGEFDSYADAKHWVSENHPGTTTYHTGPAGARQLKWETACKHCGRAFDKPYLK